jgi:glycosyltransferase involved in cell wall biosynthesis
VETVRYHFLKHTDPFPLLKYPLVFGGKLLPELFNWLFWLKSEYRKAYEILVKEKYDLIHANDWDSLPVAVSAAKKTGSKVLFDAHEYTPAQGSNKATWRMLYQPYRDYLLRRYSGGIDSAITVCQGIVDLYKRNYGWDSEVILNAAYYVKCAFNPVNPKEINLVHHGHASSGRLLHEFIELVPLLDERFKMNFVLIRSNMPYFLKLKQMAQDIAPGRVFFWDPVEQNGLAKRLNGFDVGIPMIRASQLSYYNALPNKFFDYIMAGLAIVVTPLPMMKSIVEDYKLGAVSDDQSIASLARRLNSLQADDFNAFKKNSLAAAQTLNAEKEMDKLSGIYARMLAKT